MYYRIGTYILASPYVHTYRNVAVSANLAIYIYIYERYQLSHDAHTDIPTSSSKTSQILGRQIFKCTKQCTIYVYIYIYTHTDVCCCLSIHYLSSDDELISCQSVMAYQFACSASKECAFHELPVYILPVCVITFSDGLLV